MGHWHLQLVLFSEGIIDKRTDKEVTCLSCDEMHGSDFPEYLSLNPNADICVQCHKKQLMSVSRRSLTMQYSGSSWHKSLSHNMYLGFCSMS